jgi:hypothetical protein
MEGFITIFAPYKLKTIIQQFNHGFSYSGKVRNKSTVVASWTQETAYLMHRLGWLPIYDLLHFARIHGDTIFGKSVTQEFHTIQPEFKFREFGIEFVIPQALQNNTKMLRMLGFVLRINKDIIMNTTTNLSSSFLKTEFIRYMK